MKPKVPTLTPVILIDESALAISQALFPSKPRENPSALGGGFKPRPPSANPIPKHLQPSPAIEKSTVYDEFGLLNDSLGRKKYRDPPK